MSLSWFLLLACLCYVSEEIEAQSANSSPEGDDGAARLLSSLFGFRPCLDETCKDPSIPSSEYPVNDVPGQDYEPQEPDSASSDALVEYCLPLHASTVRGVSIISMRHPDIKDIQLKVIDDLITYTTRFSDLSAENCDPAIKLLDFIIFAVEALKLEYGYVSGTTCNYTKSDKVTDDTLSDSVSSSSPTYESTENSAKKPCPEDSEESGASYPEVVADSTPPEEIVAEADSDELSPPFVGSLRGIPGVNYPNYTDVPITSFSCADKKYIPGFYADLETGCQVFHVCYEHRRESFLCPVGTTFNQPILACDYWYSSNCSLSELYYGVNAKSEDSTKEENMDVAIEELVNVISQSKQTVHVTSHTHSKTEVDIMQFLPVKAKVIEFTKPAVADHKFVTTEKPEVQEVEEVASQIFNNIVSTATHLVSKTRDVIEKIPEPTQPKIRPELTLKVKPVEKSPKSKLAVPVAKIATVKAAVPLATKAKLAVKAAVPVAKIAAVKAAVPVAKIAAVKTAVPVAKIAAVKTAVPVAKIAAVKTAVPVAKIAAVKTAVPVAKIAAVKTAVPVAVASKAVPVVAKAKVAAALPKAAVKASVPVKAKLIASAVPLAKAKMFAPALKSVKAAAVPLVKAKMTLPLVKGKLAVAAPVKAKLVKEAAISPLTKKALALGYMKLLKAKKLALVG